MDRDRTPGVSLAHYLTDHPGTGVMFSCMSCQLHFVVPIERVVERLKATGRGDESTGIRALGLMSREPCRRCGGREWETRPELARNW